MYAVLAAPFEHIAHRDIGETGITQADVLQKRIADSKVFLNLVSELFYLATAHAKKRLLVNFSAVAHLTSDDLGRLAMLDRKLSESEGKLVLCCLCERVRAVFVASGLDERLILRETLGDGIAAFAA